SLTNQLEALDLARWRAQSGLVTELDVEQALYAAEQTRAQLPVLRNGLQQNLHRLAVLLGQTPGNLDARLNPIAGIPAVPATLMVGVPADTLRQRPDVRRAERQLAAQTARVGEAEAARYPALNLSGFIGSESQSTDLFKSVSDVSSIGGNLLVPVFNAGKLRRNVDVQEELQQQALLTWRSTVLSALEETENALASYVNEHEHQKTLKLATEAAARASELAQQQYESGLVDFQTVLTTQRSYLLLQDDLNQSNGEIVANTIRVYKALGGGWPAGTNLGASNP
ncbi:MAG TPA: TolC family protein, partial [Dongiaceae bacterium]|nr:TolC family protein [Dongiaceae bacterium]